MTAKVFPGNAFAERHVVGAHNLTECMEALDLAEAAHAAREDEAERLRALAHHLHEALAFMRSCELSGESGADHSTVISALEAYEGFEFDSERKDERTVTLTLDEIEALIYSWAVGEGEKGTLHLTAALRNAEAKLKAAQPATTPNKENS